MSTSKQLNEEIDDWVGEGSTFGEDEDGEDVDDDVQVVIEDDKDDEEEDNDEDDADGYVDMYLEDEDDTGNGEIEEDGCSDDDLLTIQGSTQKQLKFLRRRVRRTIVERTYSSDSLRSESESD